jgi:hypothetical protein
MSIQPFAVRVGVDIMLQAGGRLVPAPNRATIQPSIRRRCETQDGNQRRDDRNRNEDRMVEQHRQPEAHILVEQRRTRAIETLRSWRERRILRVRRGKLAKPVE